MISTRKTSRQPLRQRRIEPLEKRLACTANWPVIAVVAPEQIATLDGLSGAEEIVLADLNQDDLDDLIVRGNDPPTAHPADGGTAEPEPYIRVLLSKPEEGFESPSQLTSKPFGSIRVRDVDGDGRLDVIASSQTGELTAWLGRKQQDAVLFSNAITLQTDGTLAEVADLNADGRPDLIALQHNRVSVHLAQEDGFQFAPPTSYPGDFSKAFTTDGGWSGLVNIDGDDDLDLIGVCSLECDFPGHLFVRINDGEGRFDAVRSLFELPETEQALYFADTSKSHIDEVFLLLKSSASPNTELRSMNLNELALQHVGTVSEPKRISFSDINADSHFDLLVTHSQQQLDGFTSSLTVFPGDEAGFGQAVPLPVAGAGVYAGLDSESRFLALTDSSELVAQPTRSPTLFSPNLTRYQASFDGPSALIFDANHDGSIDVVATHESSLLFFLGDDGNFREVTLDLRAFSSFRVYSGSFDHQDGEDLIVLGTLADTGQSQVVRVDTTSDIPSLEQPFDVAPGIVIEMADLDADGLQDFVFRSEFDSSDPSSFVLLNRTDTWIPSFLSTTAATTAVEDLDGNGTLEVYLFDDPIQIFSYEQDRFVPWGSVPKGTTRARVFDFNSDGLRDFLSIEKKSNQGTKLTVSANQGDGTWNQWQAVAANSHELLDVNGDQLIDIASPRYFYISNGDGTWEKSAEIRSTAPEWSERNQYLDLNSDGLIDNAKLHAKTGELFAYELNSDFSWTVSDPVPVLGFEYELVDVNGDGQADLVDASEGLSLSMRTGRGWAERQLIDENSLGYHVWHRATDPRKNIVSVRPEEIAYLRQDDAGNFVESQVVVNSEIEFANANNDALPDLVLNSNDTDSIWHLDQTVMLGAEDGFAEPQTIPIDQPDLTWNGSVLRVAPWNGISAEGEVHAYVTGVPKPVLRSQPLAHVFADIDQDNDLDLVAVDAEGFLVMLGIGPGDFDMNGRIEANDIDLLRHAVSREERVDGMSNFDLNQDGVLDSLDIDNWIHDIAKTRPGDLDLDGDVDFADFLVLSFNFSKTDATWADGDVDGDGQIGFVDFVKFARQFGKRPGEAAPGLSKI